MENWSNQLLVEFTIGRKFLLKEHWELSVFLVYRRCA